MVHLSTLPLSIFHINIYIQYLVLLRFNMIFSRSSFNWNNGRNVVSNSISILCLFRLYILFILTNIPNSIVFCLCVNSISNRWHCPRSLGGRESWNLFQHTFDSKKNKARKKYGKSALDMPSFKMHTINGLRMLWICNMNRNALNSYGVYCICIFFLQK